MKLILPILFALGTAFCWGLYGHALGKARSPEGLWSPFKPYVFIGVAYVVWAIVGGAMGMKARGDTFNFFGVERHAMIYGFLAGTLGAIGAFSLTNAMMNGGKAFGPNAALFVMPIVFGGAVTITALVANYRFEKPASPVLWVGITLVVVGIVLIAANTPHHKAHGEDVKVSTPENNASAET